MCLCGCVIESVNEKKVREINYKHYLVFCPGSSVLSIHYNIENKHRVFK